MAHIRVIIQPSKFPTGWDFDMVFPIDEIIVKDIMMDRIDMPHPNADPIIRELICTPTQQIDRITETRNNIAKMISENITDAFLKWMESRDTFMGYKDEEKFTAMQRTMETYFRDFHKGEDEL